MIQAFSFYLLHSMKNRVRARLKRLRQPKYLISALVGLAYLYFLFFRQVIFENHHRAAPPFSRDLDLMPLAETGFSVLLLMAVLVPWFLPTRAAGIVFTEAEIQFLFPAPVSRRSLLRLRVAKGQIAIGFGVLVSVLIFGRVGYLAHRGYFAMTLWVVYSFLALYSMASSLAKMSLAEHGVSGLKRRVGALSALAVALGSIVVWLKWFVPSPPVSGNLTFAALLDWLARLSESGPAFYLLLPFRILIRPAFAAGWVEFLGRLVPALGILALTYVWVLRSDASFEEASLEHSAKLARWLEAARAGRAGPRMVSSKARKPPFRLEPTGFPHVAIFWKNLISAGRITPRRLLPLVIMIVVLLVVAFSGQGAGLVMMPKVIGAMAGSFAIFLILIGPLIMRNDLRDDLLHIDSLKSYPIRGWSLVLGEVLAPAAILAVAQWVLLLVAGSTLPGVVRADSLYKRFVFGLGAAILLPCISMIGVMVQNAAVLIMPGWVQLGKEQQRGIEAMGQRLIFTAATLLAVLLAAVPAVLMFSIAFFLSYWLIGLAAVPVAAIFAATGLLAEAALGVVWMGQLYDRLDASRELDSRSA